MSVPIVRDDLPRPRLTLKPRAPVTGFVDGGWWPRSRDLPTEVSALLAVLEVRLGPVESVSYHLDDWGPTPRRIMIDGSLVRLAGYRSQHPDTIDVIGARLRLTLLVVPPDVSAQVAHGALMAAGHRGNTDTVETLLLAADTGVVDGDVAEPRWELDGGPVHAH